jgi:antitoxin component of MazEF toxin-antitoxin module
MITTQVFKSGNSLAVRIPKQLSFLQAGEQVEMEVVGGSSGERIAYQIETNPLFIECGAKISGFF